MTSSGDKAPWSINTVTDETTAAKDSAPEETGEQPQTNEAETTSSETKTTKRPPRRKTSRKKTSKSATEASSEEEGDSTTTGALNRTSQSDKMKIIGELWRRMSPQVPTVCVCVTRVCVCQH